MLDELIQDFLPKFQLASKEGRYGDTVKLLEEMKSRLRATPPQPSEVIRYWEAIITGDVLPDTQSSFIAAWYNLSPQYRLPLCRILELERCREFHEPAVELLAEVGDNDTIPVLKKALGYRWDYDPWLSIPRKSLQALRAIDTPDAIAIIRQATESSEEQIREEARLLLGD